MLGNKNHMHSYRMQVIHLYSSASEKDYSQQDSEYDLACFMFANMANVIISSIYRSGLSKLHSVPW